MNVKHLTLERYYVNGRVVFYPFIASLFIFISIEFLESLSPFSSLGSSYEYYLIFLVFYFGVLVTLMPFIGKKFAVPSLVRSTYLVRKIIKVMISVSVVGFFFVLVDRVFIQGVDYSGGFAVARTVWQEGASSRVGVSSVLSVIGNLFYPMVFVSLIMSFIYFEQLRYAKIYLAMSLLICIIFSLIIGGKTEFLVFFAILISTISMRPMLGLSFIPIKLRRSFIISIVVLALMVLFVFLSRMESSSVGFYSYVESLVYRHSGQIPEELITDKSDLYYAFLGSIVYFVHVKWIFIDAINNAHSLYGNAFFNQVFNILSTRGGMDLELFGYELNWTYSGRWISFLGSIWHDFGFSGVFIVYPVLFASVFFINRKFLTASRIKRNSTLVSLIVLYALFNSFLILSSFSSLFSVVSYIYLVFTVLFFIFVYFLLSSLTIGRKNNNGLIGD